MPKVALEVPQTYENISRSVIQDVVRDLKDKLSLPGDPRVDMPGFSETKPQPGSEIGADEENVRFPYSDRVFIEAEENFLEEATLTTPITRRDNKVIFSDPLLNVYMRPVYIRSEVNIAIRYRGTDRTKVNRWRDHLRRKMSEGLQSILHEVIYHYAIPKEYFVLLNEIWKKRETVAGYGDTFEQWLVNHFTARLTSLSNLDGSEPLLVIPEKQIAIQGWNDFNTEPDLPEKSQEGGGWEIQFNYTFRYDKVTAMVVDYPIVVHNQLLDLDFVYSNKAYNPYEEPRRPSLSGFLNDTFAIPAEKRSAPYEGVVIPAYDDWRPEGYKNMQVVPIASTLIGVDEENPTYVANLAELGDIAFSEKVLDFFKENHESLHRYMSNPFHVQFFKGQHLVPESEVSVDADLNIYLKTPMNPRDIHHLRVAMLHNLRNLKKEGQEALKKEPEIFGSVLDVVDILGRPNIHIKDRPATSQVSRLNVKATRFNNATSKPGFTTPGTAEENQHIEPKPANPYRPSRTTQRTQNKTARPTYSKNRNDAFKTNAPLSDEMVVLGNGRVTDQSFDFIVQHLKNPKSLGNLGQGRGMQTVMQAGIITHEV